MLPFTYVVVLTTAFFAVTLAQDFDYQPAARPAPARINPSYSGPTAPKPTPVAILKQINRHNEDGSYTYGYEGADGSFKIETKLPTGEVRGKYGYVDDTGKVRVVEYGATKYGFEPSGEGITVAPPTLVDETTSKDGTLLPEYSGAYYNQDQQAPVRTVPVRPAPRPRPQPQQTYESYSPPQQFEPAPLPPPRRTASPVPQRATIPSASLFSSQSFDFGPPSRSSSFSASPSYAPAPRPAPRPAPIGFANPAPIEEEDYNEPAPIRTAPRITYAQPVPQSRPAPASFAPAPRPQPQYSPRPAASQLSGRGGGILDQLSKDYALPQGGAAPLHDISFGYY